MATSSFVDAVALQRLEPSRAPSMDKISTLSRAQDNSSTFDRPTLPATRSRRQRLKESGWLDRRTFACYGCLLVAGWSDASAGPLLPAIQDHYGINYATVSCIWISQAVGFVIGSLLNVHLLEYFGQGAYFALGAAIQMCAYAFVVPALPFPVFCVAWVFLGFAMSGQDAIANTYIAAMPSAAQKLGILHAVYGLGALITPLTSTALLDAGVAWNYSYALTMGIAAINLATIIWGFRFEREKEGVQPAPEADETSGTQTSEPVDETASARLKRVLKSRVTLLTATFLFFYVGLEVSEGGWLVSYLIDERQGSTRAGYVASGFWAGIMLGRLALPRFNVWIGEWRAIILLIALALVANLLVFLIPNFVSSAVWYAISGVLVGPIYPTAISLATKLLPRSLHTGAVGFCASFGMTGSAVFPFIVGALAQATSTNVLQPALMIMLGVMLSVWLLVPRPKRSRD